MAQQCCVWPIIITTLPARGIYCRGIWNLTLMKDPTNVQFARRVSKLWPCYKIMPTHTQVSNPITLFCSPYICCYPIENHPCCCLWIWLYVLIIKYPLWSPENCVKSLKFVPICHQVLKILHLWKADAFTKILSSEN